VRPIGTTARRGREQQHTICAWQLRRELLARRLRGPHWLPHRQTQAEWALTDAGVASEPLPPRTCRRALAIALAQVRASSPSTAKEHIIVWPASSTVRTFGATLICTTAVPEVLRHPVKRRQKVVASPHCSSKRVATNAFSLFPASSRVNGWKLVTCRRLGFETAKPS
jgi:cell envelope opacity-associated protein A